MELNLNLSDKAQQDFRLVELARKGDQKAFAELLGRYRDTIYYMLLKMVNNPDRCRGSYYRGFWKSL